MVADGSCLVEVTYFEGCVWARRADCAARGVIVVMPCRAGLYRSRESQVMMKLQGRRRVCIVKWTREITGLEVCVADGHDGSKRDEISCVL